MRQPIKMIELHVCEKESGCLSSAEPRCSNKNVAQDLQEIVGEPYCCCCVFGGIVEDLQETVVVGVWRVVKLSIYKKPWYVVFVRDMWYLCVVCGIVEMKVYCFMTKIGSSSANRRRLVSWGLRSSSDC